MEIKVLDESNRERWDAFVEASSKATFFHKAGWREVLERGLNHRAYFLYAEENGQIRGVLPLAHVQSRLFGNALTSTPLCVYGGAVADSAQIRAELEQQASRMARTLQVDYLEFRNLGPTAAQRPRKDLYVTFRKALDPVPEKNFLAIPRKQRAMVRKGMERGLRAVIDPTADRLYEVYAESVRNLGTPVFSKRLFCVLKEVFGEACEVLSVEHERGVVSSVMSFYFRDEVLPYYGGGTARARDLYANDFMYWKVMERAVERGVRVFDYGRSKKGTGSYRFKSHWGFEPIPLNYEYELVRAKAIPDVNPLNPKYRLFIAAWKHLPLPLSKVLGPWLARNLG